MLTNPIEYLRLYRRHIDTALQWVTEKDLNSAIILINGAAQHKLPVYVIGNGGSASLSQHFACDHTKAVHADTYPINKPNVISLASNIALMTAIANDYSYEEVFSKQLEYAKNTHKKAVLVAISASGNSPNIVKAIETVRPAWSVLTMTGFDGGKIKNMGSTNLHIPSHNYGVVEDCHQILMHSIAQWTRIEFSEKQSLTL